jgi:hypothetical protein
MLAAVATESPHCLFCGDLLSKGILTSSSALTASAETAQGVKCTSCDTTMRFFNTNKLAEDLALSTYCITCGGEALETDEFEDTAPPKEEFEDESSSGLTAEAEDSSGFPDIGEEDDDTFDDDASKSAMEESEDATKEALEGEATNNSDGSKIVAKPITAKSLQWSVLDNEDSPDGTLIAASDKGIPVFMFRKKNAPEGMQGLFASAAFVSAFNQVAEDRSLQDAVKAFGGQTFKSEDIMSSIDLEAMALNRLQATAIPKLIDCCQMAVEGGAKGIYSEVTSAIQDSLTSELIASGIPLDRARTAVNNAFALNGSALFGAIIAKAMELFNKSDKVRQEAKAMITSAVGPTFQPYDVDQLKVRAALDKPDLVVTPAVSLTASTYTPDLLALRRELF